MAVEQSLEHVISRFFFSSLGVHPISEAGRTVSRFQAMLLRPAFGHVITFFRTQGACQDARKA